MNFQLLRLLSTHLLVYQSLDFLDFTFCGISQFPGFHDFLDFAFCWISLFAGFHDFLDSTVSWISLFAGFRNFLDVTISWISLFAGFRHLLDCTISWMSLLLDFAISRMWQFLRCGMFQAGSGTWNFPAASTLCTRAVGASEPDIIVTHLAIEPADNYDLIGRPVVQDHLVRLQGPCHCHVECVSRVLLHGSQPERRAAGVTRLGPRLL